MNVVGYGGGTNSTAMLIGLWQRRIPVILQKKFHILDGFVNGNITEANPPQSK